MKSQAERKADLAARRAEIHAKYNPAEATRTVVVKSYTDAAEYEADANFMVGEGWTPAMQSTGTGKRNTGRTLGKAAVFLPWALIRPSRQADPITVTWTR